MMTTSNRSKRSRRDTTRTPQPGLGKEALALVLLAITAFFFVALYSEYLVATGRSAANACGSTGHFIAQTHFNIFGPVAGFLLAGIFAVWSGMLLFQVQIQSWWPRIGGLALLCFAVCSLEFRFTEQSLMGVDLPYRGGLIGMYLGQAAFDAFGITGTTIFAFLAVALGLMFATGMPVANLLRVGLAMIGGAIASLGLKTPGVARKMVGGLGSAGQAAGEKIAQVTRSSRKKPDSEVTEEEKNILFGDDEDEEEEAEEE